MRETGETKDKNKLKLIGLTVLAIVLFVSVVAAVWNWVDLQKKPLEGTKRQFDASLDFVKTIATIAGGVVLFLNFRVANRSVELAQKKLDQETEKAKADAKLAEARLTMERFSKAVDMMGSDKSIHLRLGGIYALESIALDSSDDKIDENYRQVLEVLTAFVRENSPYPPRKQPEKEPTIPSQPIEQPTAEVGEQHDEIPPLPTDIQAALTVLNRRKHKDTDWEEHPLYLRKTDLRRADLSEANLQGAYLNQANLQDAFFTGANFQKATLNQANLQEAYFTEANFQRAYLYETDLQMAYLYGTNFQEASLYGANFQGASLGKANFQGASLSEANFQGANLSGADLREASLSEANFQGANLSGADLREANLSGANFQEVILLCTDLRNTKNLIQGCLEGEKQPFLCNVALSSGCTVSPNRDCDRLPQELVKRYPDQFPSLEEAKIYVDEQRQKKWE